MTTSTKRDAVTAAMSVAEDIAEGRLDPAAVQQQAVTELRDLVGTVVGDGDPLWELQREIARQAVGLGALGPDELREWAAVLDRQRGVEPVEAPEPHDDPIRMVSSASVALRPDYGAAEVEPDPDPVSDVEPELPPVTDDSEPDGHSVTPVAAPRPAEDGYDVLRGWNAGGSRRL